MRANLTTKRGDSGSAGLPEEKCVIIWAPKLVTKNDQKLTTTRKSDKNHQNPQNTKINKIKKTEKVIKSTKCKIDKSVKSEKHKKWKLKSEKT